MKIPSESSGFLEGFLPSLLFWSPNILAFVFPSLRYVIGLYNFVMFFILLETVAHVKFKG